MQWLRNLALLLLDALVLVEQCMLSQVRSLLEERLSELRRVVLAASLLRSLVEVLDGAFALASDVLKAQLRVLGVLQLLVVVRCADEGLARKLHEVPVVLQVAADDWPLVLQIVLDLRVTCAQL